MVRYLPGRHLAGLALFACVIAWLLTLGCALVLIIGLASHGSLPVPPLILFCAGMWPAMASARQFQRIRSVRAGIPPGPRPLRRLGDLTVTGAEEHRELRSIGRTRAEVIAGTDSLLGSLTALPGLQIFRGVRSPAAPGTLAAHAVSAGRRLYLIESVAWPAGRYSMAADGKIRCDGRAIGQSAAGLSRAVAAVTAMLPRSHRVRGLVVVHPTDGDGYRLPNGNRSIDWVLADDLAPHLYDVLHWHGTTVSCHVLAALNPAVAPVPAAPVPVPAVADPPAAEPDLRRAA